MVTMTNIPLGVIPENPVMHMEISPELSLKELLVDLPPLSNGMDLDPITLEIEKERVEYLEKSKHLQEQLRDLKKEIEGLKLEEKQTPYDMIHQEQVQSGENKYSTLRKVSFAFKTHLLLIRCIYHIVPLINGKLFIIFLDKIGFNEIQSCLLRRVVRVPIDETSLFY